MAKTSIRKHASPRKGGQTRRSSASRGRKTSSRPRTARSARSPKSEAAVREPDVMDEQALAQARVREDESEDEEGAYETGRGETDNR